MKGTELVGLFQVLLWWLWRNIHR